MYFKVNSFPAKLDEIADSPAKLIVRAIEIEQQSLPTLEKRVVGEFYEKLDR